MAPSTPISSRVLDEYHSALIEHALGWSQRYELFGPLSAGVDLSSVYMKEALTAGTFAYFCTPSGASVEQSCRNVEFVCLFLQLDDMTSKATMVNEVWVEFCVELNDVVKKGLPARQYHRALSDWQESVQRGIGADFRMVMVRQSLLAYFASLDVERSVSLDKMGIDDYWELRHGTIFVDPYVAHWAAELGVVLGSGIYDELSVIRRLSRELVCLTNDVGSVVRDVATGDINLAVIYTRIFECSIEEAVQMLIRQRALLVSEFYRELQRVRGVYGDSMVQRFLSLLVQTVNGDLRATRYLTHRFPESTSRLALLDELQA